MFKYLRALAVAGVSVTTFPAAANEADMPLVSQGLQPGPGPMFDLYPAQPPMGYVEGTYMQGSGEAGGFEGSGSAWTLRGAINARGGEHLNFQIDGAYSRSSIEGVEVNTLTGAGHLYVRDEDKYAAGVFLQGSRFTSPLLELVGPFGLDEYATDYVGGLEAALFTDFATFYGQAGLGQAEYTGYGADHKLAKLGARLYATDNIRLDVEGVYQKLSAGGVDAELLSASAIGNYRVSNFPVTVFAGYRYDDGKASVGGSEIGNAYAHNVLGGLRFSFGSSSLKQEERQGPAWSTSSIGF